MDYKFYLYALGLGLSLAMDAFSVSLANGLNEPRMSKPKMVTIAAIFGLFQAIMPLIGWVCIHSVLKYFNTLEKLVPWVAFFVLLYIGSKMIYDGMNKKEGSGLTKISFWGVIVQAVATSIDALSVGFSIADYSGVLAIITSIIIFLIAAPLINDCTFSLANACFSTSSLLALGLTSILSLILPFTDTIIVTVLSLVFASSNSGHTA